jgi:hypothetical protein
LLLCFYIVSQKPIGYTMVALTCLILAHLLCFLSLFFVSSDAPEFLIIMRGAILEGCRPNNSLQRYIFVLQRCHFYTIFYVVHPSGTLLITPYKLVWCRYQNSGTNFLSCCRDTSYFLSKLRRSSTT